MSSCRAATIYERRIREDQSAVRVRYDDGEAAEIPVPKATVIDTPDRAVFRPGVRVRTSGEPCPRILEILGEDRAHLNALEQLSRLGYDDGPTEKMAMIYRNRVTPVEEPESCNV